MRGILNEVHQLRSTTCTDDLAIIGRKSILRLAQVPDEEVKGRGKGYQAVYSALVWALFTWCGGIREEVWSTGVWRLAFGVFILVCV